jgi:quercetin dioxygenase-like cupin family protein
MMHRLRIAVLLAFVAALGGVALAASTPTVMVAGQERWAPQPGNFSMAVLYGDPSKSGFYVVRLKVPPNWSFPAHTHPQRENVTVISGTFYAGIGRKLNKNAVQAYPAGSFVSLPANIPHYALTRSSPAVVQVEGQGPFQTTMIK